MKKMILAAALIAASASAMNAEEVSYAPEEGEFSVEIEFNPFSNDFSTFKIEQLKGRYFFTDKDAIRFGVGFGVDHSKTVSDPDNNPDTWSKSTTGNFSIDLGYERNFFNYKRINLYAGAGLGYAFQSVSETSHAEQHYDDYDIIANGESHNVNSNGDRAYHEFNVKAFTGIDFFVYKGLFIGAEFGVKFAGQILPAYYSSSDIHSTQTPDIYASSKESDKQDKATSFSLKTYIEPAIRLGWAF